MEILEEVLRRIKPTEEENKKLLEIQRFFEEKLKQIEGFSFVDVYPAGSFARDTHLRGSSDIDIFLLYPKDVPFEKIEAEVKKLASLLGGEVNYAQHPYIRIGDVEIVPAYKIEEGERPISATDRTPLHNKYVKSHLKNHQKDEVRLLKAFMKGIGVYGAEVKVEGFSGYLCELLIVKYGSFLDVLRAASHWKYGEYIDIEGNGRVRERRPLIVVDPVDPYRNVAHTVSKKSLAIFITASRSFLKEPSLSFFFPNRLLLSPREIRNILLKRNSRLVAVVMKVNGPPDNIWAQLKRFGRLLDRSLRAKNNIMLQWDVWTDEKGIGVFVGEIVGRYTAFIHKRIGPPVYNKEHADRFVEIHKEDEFGPFVEEDRLVSFYMKEEKSLLVEVMDSVMEIVENESVGGEVLEGLKRGFEVIEGMEVLKLTKNDDFREFLSHFLVRKFPWQL